MLPQNKPDRIRILFDDHRLVANAGLILPATLALRLGLPQLLRKHLDLGGAPGRANTGDKMMTLVASALAGGDCIDDADVLRAGGTARVLGFTAKAPSTLGTFLRSFRCAQLDKVEKLHAEVHIGTVSGNRAGAVAGALMPRAHRAQPCEWRPVRAILGRCVRQHTDASPPYARPADRCPPSDTTPSSLVGPPNGSCL